MYKNRVLRGKGEEREGEDISGAGEAFWTGVWTFMTVGRTEFFLRPQKIRKEKKKKKEAPKDFVHIVKITNLKSDLSSTLGVLWRKRGPWIW